MRKLSSFYPAHRLSLEGNRVEFCIPDSALGTLICRQRLVWGKVNGVIQPCILHPGIKYPDFQPVKAEKVYG